MTICLPSDHATTSRTTPSRPSINAYHPLPKVVTFVSGCFFVCISLGLKFRHAQKCISTIGIILELLIKCIFILSCNWRFIPKSFFCTFSRWRRYKKCIFSSFSGWRLHEKCIFLSSSVWRLYKKTFSAISPYGDCMKNHFYTHLCMETVYKFFFDRFSVWRLYINSFSTISPYRDCIKNSHFIHSSLGATPIYSSTNNDYSCNSNIGYFFYHFIEF